jgi:hypothetical protein
MKHQTPNPKPQTGAKSTFPYDGDWAVLLMFGSWSLFDAWCLVFGVFIP